MAEINQKGLVIQIIYGKITEINLVILVTFKLTTPSLLLFRFIHIDTNQLIIYRYLRNICLGQSLAQSHVY